MKIEATAGTPAKEQAGDAILGSPSGLKRIAFLGNYIPRMCGIATFTNALFEAVARAAPGADCYVVAVTDTVDGYDYPEAVNIRLQEKDLQAYRRTADVLNFKNADVICVQHEFGIYGGSEGSYLLSLLRELRMPIVTTLHTILEEPNTKQKKVMRELTRLSDRLVVMSEKGRALLKQIYAVAESKIDVIPHGIPEEALLDTEIHKEQLGLSGRRVLLTFGLIGPGKGIEHVIKALPAIIKRHPTVVYMILGATHPKLLVEEGERYRHSLIGLVEKTRVEKHVVFLNRFVPVEDLRDFIGATDIYVTPYLDQSQITSGTLAYAFGSGKVVASTPYWHAEELLADGCGVLVPFRQPKALAQAVCNLLDDPEKMRTMQLKAYAAGRKMIWPAVAEQYLESFLRARANWSAPPRTAFTDWTLQNRPGLLPDRKLEHIARMSDRNGIFQHAIFNVPNYHEGYCVDDNARAFILCLLLAEEEHAPAAENLENFTSVYLAFIAAALDYKTGRFRNFMSHRREWLEHAGSEDSHGRSLWAVGIGADRASNEDYRRLSAQLFEVGLPAVESFTSPRAWAFTLLGIDAYLKIQPDDRRALRIARELTRRISALWHAHSDENWPWFERSLTYENARLSQAMILFGQRESDSKILELGLRSLCWLVSIQTTPDGCFRPIGSDGFYLRQGNRADFDQQPVEAQAMVAACLAAHRATGDHQWLDQARRTFEWFLGRNDLGLPLYDFASGGCRDGLHIDRVNANQGAESTLAFHLSLSDMYDAEHEAITSQNGERLALNHHEKDQPAPTPH